MQALDLTVSPILVAGPIAWRGGQLEHEPDVGLAPAASSVTTAGTVSAILTIENLASFNRHARRAASL